MDIPGRWTAVLSVVLLLLGPGQVKGVYNQCHADEYQCESSSTCIRKDFKCDGIPDCPKKDDERGCKLECNTERNFHCDNGNCVDLRMKCDRADDCGDNSDESFCDFPSTDTPLSCKSTEFQCHSPSKCIWKDEVCDGFDDCSDGSDEQGCPVTCPPGQVLCKNEKQCVHKRDLCNGIPDCEDESDEADCSDPHRHNPCSTSDIKDGFVCDNYQQCLAPWKVCDGFAHCNDSSDEKNDCATACKDLRISCSHCFPSSKGEDVECRCRQGYQVTQNQDGTDIRCEDTDECNSTLDAPLCSQECHNMPGMFYCDCDRGYERNADLRTCRATGPEPVLVYATMDEIRTFSLNTHVYEIVKEGLNGIKAIAVDAQRNVVFWSQSGEEPGVFSMDITQPGSAHSVYASFGLEAPTGLAFDYIRHNVYVADAHQPAIFACNVTCVAIFNSSVVEHPTQLAIDVVRSTLYWIDLRAPAVIMAGWLDGEASWEFLTNIHQPEALAIDRVKERLFWADKRHNVIESIGLDGTGRQVVVVHSVAFPATLAVFEDRLFWANQDHRNIMAASKFNGTGVTTVIREVPLPTALDVLHPSLQLPTKSRDPCSHNRCEHMCLKGKEDSFKCICLPGQVPSPSGLFCVDSPDPNQWASVLLISTETSILEMPLKTSGGVTVHSLTTSSMTSVFALAYLPDSDQIVYSDLDPVSHRVSMNKLTSLARTPVSDPFLTNLDIVESLAVDEGSQIVYWVNGETQNIEVSTLSGYDRAILPVANVTDPLAITLDMKNRMLFISTAGDTESTIIACHQDGSACRILTSSEIVWPNCLYARDGTLYWSDFDERVISSIGVDGQDRRILVHTYGQPVSFTLVKSKLFWIEHDSQFISYIDVDADSRSPKQLDAQTSPLNELLATSHLSYESPCSTLNNGCDHICLPRLDGMTCLCRAGYKLKEDGKTCLKNVIQCEESVCPDGQTCLDVSQKCDGNTDCPDGSDERHCPVLPKDRPACRDDQFRCPDGFCISGDWRCDGDMDCKDGSDELQNCSATRTCKPEEFRCDQHTCRSHNDLCDNYKDCHDGTDEMNCPEVTCQPGQHRCDISEGTAMCYPANWVCDGDAECRDGSDEMGCPAEKCEKSTEFYCSADNRCISEIFHCDGKLDCSEGEDEEFCPGVCSSEEFQCDPEHHPTICVPLHEVCNGVVDCSNTGRDEDPAHCQRSDGCPDQFRCRSGHRVDWSARCNDAPDCADGSDETNCTVTCKTLGCSQPPCVFDCEGPHCRCDTGYKLVNGNFCEDIDECENGNGGCSQTCVNKKGSFECTCVDGYKLVRDGRTCLAAEGSRRLFYLTTETELCRLSSEGLSKVTTIQGHGMARPRQHLDINAHTGDLFWLQAQADGSTTVYKTSGKKSRPLIQGLGTVRGLTVDWITGNIFLTQDKEVLLYDKNGENSAVLHRHAFDVYDIVAHPGSRMLFWIAGEGETFHVMTSLMNGQDWRPLHTFQGSSENFGLSLDLATERLYVKQTPSISLISLGVDGRHSHEQKLPLTLKAASLMDVFEGMAYLLEHGTTLVRVQTFDREVREDTVTVLQELEETVLWEEMTAFRVMHKFKQPVSENKCAGKQCQYLCVPMRVGEAKCMCPTRFRNRRNPTCEGPLIVPTSAPPTAQTPGPPTAQTPGPPTAQTPAPPMMHTPGPISERVTREPCLLDCANGGRCVTRPDNITYCSCAPGFTGPRCERPQEGSKAEEEESLVWITGVVLGVLALVAAVLVGVYCCRQRSYSPSLMSAIKFRNAHLGHPKKEDQEDLVPEISFGNPGFQDEFEEDVNSDPDWWKRLLNRSRSSVDSAYVSKRCSDPESPKSKPIHTDPNDNEVDFDREMLLK